MTRALSRLAAQVAVALLVAAVAAGAAFALSEDSPPRAEARLTLTTEVYWPYYDAVRQEQQHFLALPETRQAIEDAAAPATVHSVEATLPGNQSFLDVRIEASTQEGALAAVDEAVELLLENDLEVVNQPLVERAEAFEAELEPILAQREEFGNDWPPERQEIEQRYVELQWELDQLRAEIASPAPRIAVLDGPHMDDAAEDVPARNAAVAGVLGFLVALTAARALTPVLERRRSGTRRSRSARTAVAHDPNAAAL